MTEDQIAKVAQAIDSVHLFSRHNNWASDRVPGMPIEICRYGSDDEDEIVVVARYGPGVSETGALNEHVSRARAIAAIHAME